ncbi:unnamed protein product [Lymnaea stagnalis]|uniref:KANL2-like probable zinc-finger domain-containing protein n=1 Tax=Lymnaea stagnalis TaxID=6523 RepID=A0AAV2HK30_LYMST
MCHRPQRTMYEGKNIHYSSTDSKLLCSFSGKLCNQRRLNGYGFCIRHILEDPNAPFKQCAYVAKSSNQMCTQAIPKHEERRYCNNHMQVLGMLPKKERKKKDKPITVPEIKQPLVISGGIKAKFSLSSAKDNSVPIFKSNPTADDPDDPYAFPDAGPTDNKTNAGSGNIPLSSDSILGKSLQSGQGFVRSASDISNTSGLMAGGSMIAKYYPELAEKLEKMRAKPEPKTTAKSRARSSRTMNKLQTKIAQNKINEKLRKSHELSQTDSNSSPLQISSPEQSFGLEHSPSPGSGFSPASSHTFSPQASTSAPFSANLMLANFEQGHSAQDIPPLPHVDTSFLATLAAQDNLGFQNSGVGETDRLVTSHTPPRLPPPYPGSSTLSTPCSLASSDLPVSAFSPQTNLNCVIESLSSARSPQRTAITQVGPSGPSSLSSLTFIPVNPRQTSLQTTSASSSFLPLTSSSFPASSAPSYHFTTNLNTTGVKLPNHMTSSVAPQNVDIFSLLSLNSKLSMDSAQSLMLPSPNTLAAHLSLPPPPPYVPPAPQQHKVTSAALSTPPVTKVTPAVVSTVASKRSIPHTKLHKLNGILSEKAAKKKLKSDLAVKFYSFYAKRKISNHCMMGPYLCSSDDDSEDEDIDMLPWQRDVFSASSDEEADSDDELENDVPMGMRPTKISLLKTRLRRQWCQAKHAYKINSAVRKNNNQATLALIRTARDSAACAVRALWQITHVKKSKRNYETHISVHNHRSKKSSIKKKICCHKSEKEGQCQNQCLPYANHCVKHITYNINQQLFDFCTAKFANNVQCCLPSFDLRHELALCQEHAAKADNYQKQLELENKKKPRKKSKPPALTRPPRKGKKKKKGRYSKAQKPLPPPVSIGLDSTLSDVDVTSIDISKPEESPDTSTSTKEKSSNSVPHQPSVLPSRYTTEAKDTNKNLDHALELAEVLSPDFDKPFELPLEQASRLLEESDFQEVVNKMPFDELDLFGKNGDPDQDADHLGIDLVSASKARDALEKLLSGTMSEEESLQLAMVLAQNLQTDDLSHNDVIPNNNAHGDTRLMSGAEISMGSHMNEASDMDSNSMEHQIMSMHPSNLSDGSGYGISHSALHSSYQQQILTSQHSGVLQQPHLTTASLTLGSYRQMDSQKMSELSHQQIQTSMASGGSTLQSIDVMPPVLTADLNAVYGQIESLTRSQLAAKQSSGLNLNHISGLDSFTTTTAKTVIRHLPTESQPVSSVAGSPSNIYVGSAKNVYTTSQSMSSSSSSQLPPQMSLDVARGAAHPDTAVTTHGFNTSSLPAMNAHLRTSSVPQLQNFTTYSSSSTSLPSSELSYSLSLPSNAKKAKLDLSSQSVIPNSKQVQQHIQNQKLQQQLLQQKQQQGSTKVRSMLQVPAASSNTKLTLPEANRNFRQPDSKSPASPKPKNSQSPSSKQRLTLPVTQSMQQDGFLSSYTQKSTLSCDSLKLKLPTSNAILNESNQSRITISESTMSYQIMNSVSSSHSGPMTSNTVRYSVIPDGTPTSSSSLSSLTSTTTIRHSLLGEPGNGASESISVTVRHPSPLESVPTTVRHTLPDTFPTPMTLPSSPALPLPHKSSTVSSSLEANLQSKVATGNMNSSQSSNSLTSQWSSQGSLAANINLQNGLPFAAGSSRTQIAHRFSPAGQGNARSKSNNAAAEAARITALANAAGVPVVCSPVSLPGLVQSLSTATFKSSGSS